MKKSTIWFLTITMAATFIGLLLTQVMYMENMIKMRKEQFTEAVKRSLYAVSTSLERDETRAYLAEAIDEELLSTYEDDATSDVVIPQLSITAPDGTTITVPL